VSFAMPVVANAAARSTLMIQTTNASALRFCSIEPPSDSCRVYCLGNAELQDPGRKTPATQHPTTTNRMPDYAIFILIGLGAGTLAGLFGIGGGIIIVPALVFFAGFAQRVANGTSLAVFLLPVGALGAWAYYKEGNVKVVPALIMAAGLFIGSFIGAKLNHALPLPVIRRGFALLLVVTAARMWFAK